MLDQPNPDLTQAIKKISRPLDRWRRSGRRPRTIPEAIWSQAVELAAIHGVGPVARGLRLHYAKLKSDVARREAPAKALVPRPGDPSPAVDFIEFLSMPTLPPDPGGSRCSVEVESRQGAKLRVKLGGLDVAGLVTLVRGFLGA